MVSRSNSCPQAKQAASDLGVSAKQMINRGVDSSGPHRRAPSVAIFQTGPYGPPRPGPTDGALSERRARGEARAAVPRYPSYGPGRTSGRREMLEAFLRLASV